MELKSCIGFLKESLKNELHEMRVLKGDKLKTFLDTFYLELDEEDRIYYNTYNIALTSEELHQSMMPYLRDNSKILSMEIPEHNTYLYVYSYCTDAILTNYL